MKEIRKIVEKELSCSAHNMDHIDRVYNLCLHLAEGLDVDLEVLEAAALLHDIARVKEDNDNSGSTDHAVLGAEMAEKILQNLDFPIEKVQHIKDCIVSHRYRTSITPKTIEAQILFDADKLDTLGAIGIVRSYLWVARNNAKIFSNTDIDEYIKDNLGGKINRRIQDKTKHSPCIEFETKLKFLEQKLHTEKAKGICRERTKFYKVFLERLGKEIKGEL